MSDRSASGAAIHTASGARLDFSSPSKQPISRSSRMGREFDCVPVFQRQRLPASRSPRSCQSKARTLRYPSVALLSFDFIALVIITVTVTTHSYGTLHAAKQMRSISVRHTSIVDKSASNLRHNGGTEDRSPSAPNLYYNQREEKSPSFNSKFSLWQQQVGCEGKKPLLTCKRHKGRSVYVALADDRFAQISKYLYNKSCALVGSSSLLLNRSYGSDIDSRDLVVRINDAPIRGYENYVKSRTADVIFISADAGIATMQPE
ncbi:uncharacterized protein LOC134188187 [Corticium candelabrum]|uniref:uncharacterized protein LOC134188187 n=1 Tax=Corticium candelabrum TaxID=121492 RepID=UPI002E268115|nr:uncharacterized protein LOC134188187 [Corticium candelabrum]